MLTVDLDSLIAIAERKATQALYLSTGTFKRWEDNLVRCRDMLAFLVDSRYELSPKVVCDLCKGTGRLPDGWQGHPVPAGCGTCRGTGQAAK